MTLGKQLLLYGGVYSASFGVGVLHGYYAANGTPMPALGAVSTIVPAASGLVAGVLGPSRAVHDPINGISDYLNRPISPKKTLGHFCLGVAGSNIAETLGYAVGYGMK